VSDEANKRSKLARIGIPLLWLAFGLLNGATHHAHGSNDWGGAIFLMVGYPVMLVGLSLGAAFAAGKTLGRWCTYGMIFLVASVIGRFFLSGHPF
jgi:hypothetical protein